MRVNAKGVFFCLQRVAREMIPRRSGVIVNIASIAGKGYAGTSNAIYAGQQGQRHLADAHRRAAARPPQHQRQRDLPGHHGHRALRGQRGRPRPRGGRHRRGDGRAGATPPSRSAARTSRRTSRPSPCSWPRRARGTSPASPSTWTAASSSTDSGPRRPHHERRRLGAPARLSRRRRLHGPQGRGARLRVLLVRRAPVHPGADGQPLPGLGGRRHPRELLALRRPVRGAGARLGDDEPHQARHRHRAGARAAPAAAGQGGVHARSLQRRALPLRHRRGLAARGDARSWAATSTTAGRRRGSRSWP